MLPTKRLSAPGRTQLRSTDAASVARGDFTEDGRGGDMDYPYNLGFYTRKVTTSSADTPIPSVGSTAASTGALATTMRKRSPASRRR